jgi:hypothetical protein
VVLSNRKSLPDKSLAQIGVNNKVKTWKLASLLHSDCSHREEAGPARWEFENDEAYRAAKLHFDRTGSCHGSSSPPRIVETGQDTHGSSNNTTAASTSVEPNTVEEHPPVKAVVDALEIQRIHGMGLDGVESSGDPPMMLPPLRQSQDGSSTTEKPAGHGPSHAKAQEDLPSQSTQVL